MSVTYESGYGGYYVVGNWDANETDVEDEYEDVSENQENNDGLQEYDLVHDDNFVKDYTTINCFLNILNFDVLNITK